MRSNSTASVDRAAMAPNQIPSGSVPGPGEHPDPNIPPDPGSEATWYSGSPTVYQTSVVVVVVGGAVVVIVVVVVDVVVEDVVVDEAASEDDTVVLACGVAGAVSAESPVLQPTNTISTVSVHNFDAMASTSTYHHPHPIIGAQEANDPPISAHMRYLD